jgi:hypothetical protein
MPTPVAWCLKERIRGIRMNSYMKGLLALTVLLLTGCMSMGPRSIQTTRADYNMAIQQTNEQELLLNLVRLKYRDSIYFLNVEKVAASLEFNREMGASATVPEKGLNTYTIGAAKVGLVEKPTIFYSPLDGERFTRQMMSVLHPEVLVLLGNSGWSLERLMALMFQEMNGLKNAPSATGPTPSYEPVYKDFRQALKSLRSLQVRKLVDVGHISESGKPLLELRFLPQAADDPDTLEFKRLLGLARESNNFKVVIGLGRGGAETINVVPRSMIGILNYLSQGIEPPQKDIERGRVTRTTLANGDTFDWQTLLGGLFRISSSDSEPENASIAIRYRDSWFYIADSDLESKSTFSLMSQLMALQAGSSKQEEMPISFSIGR